MIDSFGRSISYLRLSITSACPMRCIYCRPATMAAQQGPMLSVSEIGQLVRHLVDAHGLRKVRITGGEPTSRADLLDIIRELRSIPGLAQIAMTTNGLTLLRQAPAMVEAGLDRVNVSLDSLDSAPFTRITGVNGLHRVLGGIDAAQRAGLTPVRLNTVVVRGENDHELPDLLLLAAKRGLEIRFIELMPMGPLADRWRERFVPESEMRATLGRMVEDFIPLEHGHAAARRYRVTLRDGRQTTLGFITAMSCDFCAACNRIRIAADGSVYPCLMDHPAGSLMDLVRPRFDPGAIDAFLAQALAGKRAVHPSSGAGVMIRIGG